MAKPPVQGGDDNMIDRTTRQFGKDERPREEGTATTNSTTGADANTGTGKGGEDGDPQS